MALWVRPISALSATAPTPVMIPMARAIRQRMNRLTRLSSRSLAATVSDETPVSAVADDIFGFSWDGRSEVRSPSRTFSQGTPSTLNKFRLGRSIRQAGPDSGSHHQAAQRPNRVLVEARNPRLFVFRRGR